MDWILRRCDGEKCYTESPIGLLPTKNSINLEGLGNINMEELLSVPKDFWLDEVNELYI